MRNNAAILKFFCRVKGDVPVTAVTVDRVSEAAPWRENAGLMGFLRSL